MVVDVDGTGATFQLGIPRPLFQTDVDNFDSVNRYAVTRDGKRVLVNSSIVGGNIKPIALVTNWASEIVKK
jgi:hypothetical protein